MAEYDFDAIRKALKTKVSHGRCPACKTEPTIWGGGTAVVSLPATDTETGNGKPLDQSERPSVDVLPVICDHCGWTQFFEIARLTGAD